MPQNVKYFDFADLFASFKWVWSNEKAIFEKEFAEYIGAKFAIGTSYGRTALYLGLKAMDVKNMEVIIPAFICTVVRHAVTMAGGSPRFVDINIEDFNLNLDDLKQKISDKTKAIILTHYFGRVARNIEEVIQVAKENNIVLIEDCAHSLGAEYKGRTIGTFGDFSIFSLTKGMVNFGGGVLITDNRNIYQNAKNILGEEKIPLQTRIMDFPLTLAYGFEQAIDKVVFDRVGRNMLKWWLIKLPKFLLIMRQYVIELTKITLSITRMKRKTDIQHSDDKKRAASTRYEQGIHMEPIIASIARTQLRKIDSLIERRKDICGHLTKLANCHFRCSDGFDGKDVYTHLVLRFPSSDIFEIIEKCKTYGLLLRATWPTHQKLWENQDTENVKTIEKEILAWNVNPMLNNTEIDKFIKIVNEC